MLSQLEVLPDSEPARKNGSSARRKRGRPSKNRSLLAAQLTAASDVIDAEGPYDVIKVQIEDVEEEHGSMPKRQREHSISTSSPVANVSPPSVSTSKDYWFPLRKSRCCLQTSQGLYQWRTRGLPKERVRRGPVALF